MSELQGVHPWGNWPLTFADGEYQLLESACAYLDLVQVGWLSVSGPDAGAYLGGILTADIRRLFLGRTTSAWALDASGKILFHMWVHRAAATEFLIQTGSQHTAGLFAHLDKYLVMENATITARSDLACISLQGATAKDVVASFKLDGLVVLQNDRCGFGGLDLVITADALPQLRQALQAAQVPPIGLAALHIARTEHFLPLFECDMLAGNNPLLYGKGGERISYTKGCFLGQETVARARDRGHPPKLLVLLCAQGTDVPVGGGELFEDGKLVGSITSSVFSARQNQLLAFALIKYASAQTDRVLVDAARNNWRIMVVSDYDSD